MQIELFDWLQSKQTLSAAKKIKKKTSVFDLKKLCELAYFPLILHNSPFGKEATK